MSKTTDILSVIDSCIGILDDFVDRFFFAPMTIFQ